MKEAAARWANLSPEAQAILMPFLTPPVYAGSWFDPPGQAANRTVRAAATGSFRRFYFGGGSAIYDFTYVRACPTGSFTLPFSGASWFSTGVNGAHVPPDGATMQGTFTDGGQTYTWRLTALRE